MSEVTDAQKRPSFPHGQIDLPLFLDADYEWEKVSRSFEFRVDCKILADWLSGVAGFAYHDIGKQLTPIYSNLHSLLRNKSMFLRWSWASWVSWVPRERNVLADHIANLALDRRASLMVPGSRIFSADDCNFIIMSDGAVRKRSGAASASWAILAMSGIEVSFVGGGAQILSHGTQSLEAELKGLQLALHAFQRLVDDRAIICPHQYDITFELPKDIAQKVFKGRAE